MSLNFLKRDRLHWALLRAQSDRIGAEVEQGSYEQLAFSNGKTG